MYFKKIRESKIHDIMASLDDQKISFVSCLRTVFPYNSIGCNPENRLRCCLKTKKNGQNTADNGPQNPENDIRKWLDILFKDLPNFCVFVEVNRAHR